MALDGHAVKRRTRVDDILIGHPRGAEPASSSGPAPVALTRQADVAQLVERCHGKRVLPRDVFPGNQLVRGASRCRYRSRTAVLRKCVRRTTDAVLGAFADVSVVYVTGSSVRSCGSCSGG